MSEIKPFAFKQFKIHQDKVPMKVGTDGVLVGAWADLTAITQVLDIGTGSGLIALMMAQRLPSTARVHAIDVDEKAILQAKDNFDASPWPSKMEVYHQSIQDFARATDHRFDLIISNPPFFTGGMLSGSTPRDEARHTIKLPHGDLLWAVSKLLTPDGHLAIILPYLQGLRFIEISESYKLYPRRITEVKSKPEKSIERLLIQFGRQRSVTVMEELLIHNHENEYSEQYKSITKDFYLNF